MLNFNEFQSKIDDIQTLIKASVGIKRKDMPQIASKNNQDFIKFLSDSGIKVDKKSVAPISLGITQNELNMEKVIALMSRDYDNSKPIFISSDRRVLDGHHRFAAAYLKDSDKKITVYQVNLPIRKLLDKVRQYDRVFTKKIDEQKGT